MDFGFRIWDFGAADRNPKSQIRNIKVRNMKIFSLNILTESALKHQNLLWELEYSYKMDILRREHESEKNALLDQMAALDSELAQLKKKTPGEVVAAIDHILGHIDDPKRFAEGYLTKSKAVAAIVQALNALRYQAAGE